MVLLQTKKKIYLIHYIYTYKPYNRSHKYQIVSWNVMDKGKTWSLDYDFLIVSCDLKLVYIKMNSLNDCGNTLRHSWLKKTEFRLQRSTNSLISFVKILNLCYAFNILTTIVKWTQGLHIDICKLLQRWWPVMWTAWISGFFSSAAFK